MLETGEGKQWNHKMFSVSIVVDFYISYTSPVKGLRLIICTLRPDTVFGYVSFHYGMAQFHHLRNFLNSCEDGELHRSRGAAPNPR